MSHKILIVDDEKRIRDLIAFRLENKGFEILSAEGGKEALAITETHTPDLVVLDVMMPDMSGLELCQQLKSNDNLKHIKVLMLSAKGQKQDEEEGLKAGADGYMTKPFRAKHLIEKIEEILTSE